MESQTRQWNTWNGTRTQKSALCQSRMHGKQREVTEQWHITGHARTAAATLTQAKDAATVIQFRMKESSQG